jgi:hypothetical protein
MMKVLFIEQNITKASPLFTLADGLKCEGAEALFADLSKISTINLIKLYLRVNVVVIQYYGEIGDYEKRQLAIGGVLGVPITRNWAGTDSLNVITKSAIKSSALSLNNLLTDNITTTHEGIVNELDSIGIECNLLPQVTEFNIPLSQEDKTFSIGNVLVYLPSSNRVFYGSEHIEKLINKYPHVRFTILADEEHYFETYDNVTSLGWVSQNDMQPVWNRIGLLIRITEHDGYPRMILEALGRGKYVVHNNNNIDGVWFADNQNTIEECLNRYLQQNQINKEGVEIFDKLKKRRPSKVYHDYLSRIKIPFKTWWRSLLFILKINV